MGEEHRLGGGSRPPPFCPLGSANKATFRDQFPWWLEHPKDAVVMEMGQREEARDGQDWAREWGRLQKPQTGL